MCIMGSPSMPTPAPLRIAATDNREAAAQEDMEMRLRRRRAGAAANVLTGPRGIPTSPRMGVVS